MELAQRLYRDRGRIGYVAEACVYHHHAESWPQVQRRFEREALALQRIMPQIHARHRDAIRYIVRSHWHACRCATRACVWRRKDWWVVLSRLTLDHGPF